MSKIFKSNKDYSKTAFLNWRTSNHEDIGNLLVLAEGFLSSSIELCRNCLINNNDKKADCLIFPILHNANHGIELYLKAMIWTLNKLLGNNLKIEGNHDIRQMFFTVQSRIESYKGIKWRQHFDKKSKPLYDYIHELFGMISSPGKGNNMDFSRYPITNKYKNHFYIDQLNNVMIDLENLEKCLIKIKETLDERASYFFTKN